MTYTTKDLVKESGYVNSTIVNIMERSGIKPVKTGYNGLKYWPEEALEIVLRHKETKNTIALSTLSQLYDMSFESIRKALSAEGIEPTYSTKKNVFYPYKSKYVLKDYAKTYGFDNEKEHPLVKDKRMLNINYWPNVVPKCFEDLGDD